MESFKISRTKRITSNSDAVYSPETLLASLPTIVFGGENQDSKKKHEPKKVSLKPYVFPFKTGAKESDLKVVQSWKPHIVGPIEQELAEAKTKLDDIPPRKYRAVRDNNNPYEQISFFFQNRAAFKMAELDYHFGLVPMASGEVFQASPHPFIVADVCSGPGGFSEYILTKRKWTAKVFGFTLNNKDDFRIDNFNVSAPTQCFHPYYGVDNNGDITSLLNLKSLKKRIWDSTKGENYPNKKFPGIDLVTADGGFEISDLNKQELFTRKMLMGEFLTPLMLLRKGGDFVCKLFSTFTDFSADLLFLTTCLYDKVLFIKPISSRVANSERFLVCKGFKGIDPKLLKQLQDILILEGEIPEGSTQAATVPDSFLDHNNEEYKSFRKELDKVNETVNKMQIYHLNKIVKVANSKKNIEQEKANEKAQEKIAEEVSEIIKIHRDPKEKSPPGYLYYDPAYGTFLENSKSPKILEIIKGVKSKDTLLVKTGFFRKGRRVEKVYFMKNKKELSKIPASFEDYGEFTSKLPFDTIVDVDSGDIVYSFYPEENLDYIKIIDPSMIIDTTELDEEK